MQTSPLFAYYVSDFLWVLFVCMCVSSCLCMCVCVFIVLLKNSRSFFACLPVSLFSKEKGEEGMALGR